MLPVFKPGQVVLVSAVKAGPYLRPGDCAVYSYEGSTLLHRVVKTTESGAWFADDAGRLAPHLVPWENIRGKVLSRNPFSGGIVGAVYSELRRALFKAVPHREARP